MSRGTSSKTGSGRTSRQRRAEDARKAEDVAAGSGTMLTRGKAAATRPKRTETGGETSTRSANARTRKAVAKEHTQHEGKKLGGGRRRLGPN